MNNNDIVQKLWSFCNILRDDGITFHQYVNELTYLLFLKMVEETSIDEELPQGFRWSDLASLSGAAQFDFYRNQLVVLGTKGSDSVRAIFANPTSLLRHAESLNMLVSRIDSLDWYSAKKEGLGDLYEGLLQKNASEKKSGAGQYFTPRPLIDSIVSLMQPAIDDVIQDPAAGTGGFLVAASQFILSHANQSSWTKAQKKKYASNTFFGMEHVQDAHRLALMNLLLHGIGYKQEGFGIQYGDTLGKQGAELAARGATLVMTNPPFGTKRGSGLPARDDLKYPTSNKQLCFLQHVSKALVSGGRAAVVVPDNVLFEGNISAEIRHDLLETCDLHTILRLPTGIFYAQGVKTNVLFFNQGRKTESVWIYDMRTNSAQFGKRSYLTREHFTEFERVYGDDPRGHAKRKDQGSAGRFRRFTRKQLSENNDNLDISWLKDDSRSDNQDLPEPGVLAQSIMSEIEAAMEEMRLLLSDLGEEEEV